MNSRDKANSDNENKGKVRKTPAGSPSPITTELLGTTPDENIPAPTYSQLPKSRSLPTEYFASLRNNFTTNSLSVHEVQQQNIAALTSNEVNRHSRTNSGESFSAITPMGGPHSATSTASNISLRTPTTATATVTPRAYSSPLRSGVMSAKTSPSKLTLSPIANINTPVNPFVYQNDTSVFENDAKNIENKTEQEQKQILNQTLESIQSNIKTTLTLEEVGKKIAKDYIPHIWQENLFLLSLTLSKTPTGVYYTHGINNAVKSTCLRVVNIFHPENMAFLTEIGEFASYKVKHCDNLYKGGHERDFNFENATIVMPICYTTDHPLTGNNLRDALVNFLVSIPCRVIIYLGSDEGKEEYVKMRADWLEANQDIISDFIENNYPVEIKHWSEWIKSLDFLNAQTFFVNNLAQINSISEALAQDAIDRLRQKNYLEPVKPKGKVFRTLFVESPAPQSKSTTETTLIRGDMAHQERQLEQTVDAILARVAKVKKEDTQTKMKLALQTFFETSNVKASNEQGITIHNNNGTHLPSTSNGTASKGYGSILNMNNGSPHPLGFFITMFNNVNSDDEKKDDNKDDNNDNSLAYNSTPSPGSGSPKNG